MKITERLESFTTAPDGWRAHFPRQTDGGMAVDPYPLAGWALTRDMDTVTLRAMMQAPYGDELIFMHEMGDIYAVLGPDQGIAVEDTDYFAEALRFHVGGEAA